MEKIYEARALRRRAVVWTGSAGYRAQLYVRSRDTGRWLQSGEINARQGSRGLKRAVYFAAKWVYEEWIG